MKKSVVLFIAISLLFVVSASAQSTAKTFTNAGTENQLPLSGEECCKMYVIS
jgi:hypothetical protein